MWGRGWGAIVGEVQDFASVDGVRAPLLENPLVEQAGTLAALLGEDRCDVKWVFLGCRVRRVVGVSHGASETTDVQGEGLGCRSWLEYVTQWDSGGVGCAVWGREGG